jgi:hypothetical protein
MTKTIKFQQVPFSHWPYPLSFGIRICFEFRVSIFGFCLNMTFRSGTKYPPPFVKGAGGISSDQRKPRIFPPFFTRKCTSNILISLHAFSSCFVTGLRHVGFMGNPPRPPFFKGGDVLLFSETCRHAILSGMRSENSLGISPPLPNPEHLSLCQTLNSVWTKTPVFR